MALPANYRTPAIPPPLFGRRQSVSTPATNEGRHKGASSSQTHNPFIQGQPGHPAYAAGRFARLAESQDMANKPIKAPKAPLMPYMRYSKKMWDHVKAANPRIKSIPDIGKMIGKMWQDLSDEERREYEMEYELDKAAYQEALHNYHNSTAYQEWLKKEEMRKLQLAQEAEEKKSISSRVGVVQADEEDDNIFSLKHLASARYSRNHLLMAEIFSDTVVPDMRQVVFGKKLTTLRQQREGLDQTFALRQTDLKTQEEQHDKIRKKILADRERWDGVWADACAKKPKLTDDVFEQLLTRARQEVRDKVRQQQQMMQQQNSSSKNPQQLSAAGSANEGAVIDSSADNDTEADVPSVGAAAVVSHPEGVADAVGPSVVERVEVVNVEQRPPLDADNSRPSSTTADAEGAQKKTVELFAAVVPPAVVSDATSSSVSGQLECLDVNRTTQPPQTETSHSEIAPMMSVVGGGDGIQPPIAMETAPMADIAMNDPDDDEPEPSTTDDQQSPFAIGSQDSIPVGGGDMSSVVTDDAVRLATRPEQTEEEDEEDEDEDDMMEGDDGEADIASSASSLPVAPDQRQPPQTSDSAPTEPETDDDQKA